MSIEQVFEIRDDDELSRFLTSSGDKNQSGRIKPGAFLPNYNDEKDRFEASMFCTANLSGEQIKELLEAALPPRYYGRALIVKPTIEKAGLDVDLDNHPPRHLAVIGWDDGAEKSKRRLAAAKLANDAVYSEKPDWSPSGK